MSTGKKMNVKTKIAAAFLSIFILGCTSVEPEHLYYVIDVNGTEPDASFEDRKDAERYVKDFKEFHTYRIVKAQTYTNED